MLLIAPTRTLLPKRESLVRIGTLAIDAEARGKVRAWKRLAAQNIERLDRSWPTLQPLVEAFIAKSGAGRSRAFRRLRQEARYGAVFQTVRAYDGVPIALWVRLRPRKAVTQYGIVGHGDETKIIDPDPSRLQDCVVVEFFTAGGRGPGFARNSYGVTSGMWSLEVNDHALHRLVQRDRNVDIGKVLVAAHQAALNVDLEELQQLPAEKAFLLVAGPGVFRCTVENVTDIQTDQVRGYLRALTWLHRDQLSEKQEAEIISGTGSLRLTHAAWFVPPPLIGSVPFNEKL